VYTSNNVVTNADIIFTTRRSWSTTAECDENSKDVWAIAAHEMGHALGLGHSTNSQNTMYYDSGGLGSTTQRHLEDGDRAGAIYQSTSSPGGTLPYSQVWTSASSVSLASNVYVASGDSLLFDEQTTINLGNYDVVSTGGFLGFHRDNSSGEFNPFVGIIKSDGKYRGFYHSLSTALDSLQAGDYIYIGSDYTIASGATVSIPANTSLKFSGLATDLIVEGTLNVAGGVTFDKYDGTNWGGVNVESSGTLSITGGITVKYASIAFDLESANVTFPTTESTIENCASSSSGSAIKINNCSPTVRYIKFTDSATLSGARAVYVSGSSACPNLYWLTINDSYHGVKIASTADAILKYSILEDLLNHCIFLDDDGGTNSGSIDMSWAQTDVYPDTTNYNAIINENPQVTIQVYNNYWGSATPYPGTIFSDPGSVSYSPFAGSAFGAGSSKASALLARNPFHDALEFEQAGYLKDALDIYYELIETGNNLVWKRMAVKSILKVNELNGIEFGKLRKTIENERKTAEKWYKSFLDFMKCEILIREGQYTDAIEAFSQKALEYQGNSIEVEMLVRIANIYGDFLKDTIKAKEFADRAAAINPGAEILISAYESADVEYNPSRYVDKYENESGQNEPLPEEDSATTSGDEFVTLETNPFNPSTSIIYSIKEPSQVKLDVFSITGQKVATLANGYMSAGVHTAKFDGSRLASGVYFYRFESGSFNTKGKMLLVK